MPNWTAGHLRKRGIVQHSLGYRKKSLAICGAFVLALTLSGCSVLDPFSLLSKRSFGDSAQQTDVGNGKKESSAPTTPLTTPPKQDGNGISQPSATLCSDGTERRTILLNGQRTAGVWVGDIVEPHGAKYKVRAVLNDNGCEISGTFEYHSGLNCSGTWSSASVEHRSGANEPLDFRVNFLETVDNDPAGACAPVAEVQITYGPGGMFYASEWLRGDGEATSSKTLLQPE